MKGKLLNILLSLSGQHPRGEKLVQATQDWERGRIDRKTLEKVFEEDISSLIELQKELGFDFISDGQITMIWNDIFRPFTENARGIRKGPLVRWFNTNTFYYVPVVEDEPVSEGRIILRSTSKKILKTGAGKIVVPDPLTFVECSENRTGMKEEELMFKYAEGLLNPELRNLESSGIKYVQFSSPSLVARFRKKQVEREKLIALGEAIREALKKVNMRSGFYCYFGDASPYIPDIYDLLPTKDIGFDLTETDFRNIQPSEKCLIAGIVNSRSSYVEKPNHLSKILEWLAEKFNNVIACPSSDLHYIPREYADMKLVALQKARRLLDG